MRVREKQWPGLRVPGDFSAIGLVVERQEREAERAIDVEEYAGTAGLAAARGEPSLHDAIGARLPRLRDKRGSRRCCERLLRPRPTPQIRHKFDLEELLVVKLGRQVHLRVDLDHIVELFTRGG